ncbi:helix-turn-helix domain-containing protein [Streptomyces sp. QH1-20]|uniref:helix-turn-helix domain-containing protein n=1 Tax=Streptomyces sp. QH1-20 TaxID=3240934 RepID=UPI003514806C
MTTPGAVVQRRQLRTELKKARARAGLTQLEVAARMDWSPSKLIRIEAGQVGISTDDLRALLHEYGIVDPQRLDYFLGLALASAKLPYREYRDLLPRPYMNLLSVEVAASIVRSFEPLVIPGMLQIEEYARATSLAFSPHITGARLDRAVEARLQRQKLLASEHRPEFFFIIDEAAIHRWTGGPGVMKSQLLHLKEMATRPGISIQIVPFSIGAHVGLQGSFVLLEFNGEMDDILYLEKTSGDSVFSDDTEATSRYLETFWALEAQAPREDLPHVIDRAIEGMNGVPEARPSVEVSVEA